MNIVEQKYSKMKKACESYSAEIDNLKNLVYGYSVSLDCIVPYHSDFLSTSDDKKFVGVVDFSKLVSRYYGEFTKEISDCFNHDYLTEDKYCVEALIILISYYLKTECNKIDYTFLGLIKILKTFLGTYSDDEQRKNKDNSTFWIMLKNLSDEGKEKHPEIIQDAINSIYENFDYNYISRLADGIWYVIRYFLYEMNFDYIKDSLMMTATMDMLKEIENRLSTIKENRTPRKGWRN